MNYHIFCSALFFPNRNYGVGCYFICNDDELKKLRKMSVCELKHAIIRSAEFVGKPADNEKHAKYITVNSALNELHKKITGGNVNIYACFRVENLFRYRRNAIIDYEKEYIEFFNIFSIRVKDLRFETDEQKLMFRLRIIFNSILSKVFYYLGD